MPMLARKPKEADLSPERAALAKAIASLADAEARVKLIQEVAGSGGTLMKARWAATDAVEAAEAALKDAGPAAARYLVDQAVGAVCEAPLSIQEATARLEKARADKAAAELAEKQAEPLVREAESELGSAIRRLEDAARAVMAVDAGDYAKALGKRLARMQREMLSVAIEVRWLWKRGAFPVVTDPGIWFGHPLDEDTRRALYRMDHLNGNWHDLKPHSFEPPVAWVAAFEALQRDPTAALPVTE